MGHFFLPPVSIAQRCDGEDALCGWGRNCIGDRAVCCLSSVEVSHLLLGQFLLFCLRHRPLTDASLVMHRALSFASVQCPMTKLHILIGPSRNGTAP